MTSESQITFYTCGSPNGYKVAHTLEELGLKYEFKTLDLSANEQKSDWFLAINPNGRVPALTDVLPGGKPIRLFESGSIMQYLIARYDPHHKISYPEGTDEYYQTNNWVRTYLSRPHTAADRALYSSSGRWAALDRCRANGSTFRSTPTRPSHKTML